MNIIDNNIYNNLDLMSEDLQGWNGNSDVFEKLILETNPQVIIEVGTWKGQSAINMAKSLQKNRIDAKIYCVDTWLGALEFWDDLKDTNERNLLLKNGYPQIYYQFLSNVVHQNVQDIIVPFPVTSLIAARYFKKNNISSQLIYIDGSHEEDDVYADIKYYYSILDKGGIIFGDDYWSWNTVRTDVNKFVADALFIHDYNLEFELYQSNFWIIRKF